MKRLKPAVTDEPKTKLFSTKLCETVERAEKTRKSILHLDLMIKERSQIADEILYLIDDLQELQTIKTEEEKMIWKTSQFIRPHPGLF